MVIILNVGIGLIQKLQPILISAYLVPIVCLLNIIMWSSRIISTSLLTHDEKDVMEVIIMRGKWYIHCTVKKPCGLSKGSQAT